MQDKRAKNPSDEKDRVDGKVRDDDRKILNRVRGMDQAKKRMDEAEQYIVIVNYGHGRQALYPATDKPKLYSKAAAQKIVDKNKPTGMSFGSIQKAVFMKPASQALNSVADGSPAWTSIRNLIGEEQVNELSRDKLEKYAMRASGEHTMANFAKRSTEHDKSEKGKKDHAYFSRMTKNRKKGISRAYDRMNKIDGKVDEDAPVNATGPAVVGTGNKGEPFVGRKPLVRRKKFAGQEAFVVDSETYSNCVQGKKKYAHYKSYVGECDTGAAIRDYGRQNPGAPIIVMDERTGAASFLRYGKNGIRF